MPDYGNGKIYTIRCRTDDTLIYVGSTIQPLCERLAGHKRDSKKEKQKNRLLFIKVNGDWDNWFIELHSLYPCSCIEELQRKEGEIIREIGTLNTIIAGRSRKENYQDNKKERIDESKERYIKNKEKRLENNKKYYEANKEQVLLKAKEKYKKKKELMAVQAEQF
jgi:hypothetical protein